MTRFTIKTINFGKGEAIAKNYWNPFTQNEKGLQGMLMSSDLYLLGLKGYMRTF